MTATVQVLLATHNGLPFLDEQIDSILAQTGVAVRIVAHDDASTDGTRERLLARARQDSRITVLPEHPRLGSAAANFYHLIRHVDDSASDYFALADQDDIWHADKLQRHIELARSTGSVGISSDVTAFWPDGRTRLIRKSQPQRQWDHILEPPGPGCTFLFTPQLLRAVVFWIADLEARGIGPLTKHDWFIYLVARCSGWRWHIDDQSTLQYRQHGGNEVGANAGLAAKLKRVQVLLQGGYHRQIRHAMQVGRIVSEHARREGPPAHFTLLTLLRHGRRRSHEALLLAVLSIGRL